jgi:hypothetical protein
MHYWAVENPHWMRQQAIQNYWSLTLCLLCVPFLVHTRLLPANYLVRFGTHFTTHLDPLCTLYVHDFRSLQGDSR